MAYSVASRAFVVVVSLGTPRSHNKAAASMPLYINLTQVEVPRSLRGLINPQMETQPLSPSVCWHGGRAAKSIVLRPTELWLAMASYGWLWLVTVASTILARWSPIGTEYSTL